MSTGPGSADLCAYCGDPLPPPAERHGGQPMRFCCPLHRHRWHTDERDKARRAAQLAARAAQVAALRCGCGSPIEATGRGPIPQRCPTCTVAWRKAGWRRYSAQTHEQRRAEAQARRQAPRTCRGCSATVPPPSSKGGGVPAWCPACREQRRHEQRQAACKKHRQHKRNLHLAMLQPRTRGDCASSPRPCPWVSCRYHALLDRHEPGTTLSRLELLARADEREARALITRWAAEAASDEQPSCTLDLIEASGRLDLGTIGDMLGLSKQRAHQLAEGAFARLAPEVEGMREALADDDNDGQGGGWNGGAL